MTEAQKTELFAIRKALDNFIIKIVDNPTEINSNSTIIRNWKPANYVIGDVRNYNGIPYKCIQAHDSTENITWTPNTVSSLWMQYHGTTIETARPWIQPLGSEDIYKIDEYVIWEDKIYKCLANTNFDPITYPVAWELIV